MKPFDYQLEFIDKIRKKLSRDKRVVAQAATGFGKTVCIGEITSKALEKGNTVCISVHREEIFRQTFKALKAFGITPALIAPGHDPMPGSGCYLAMVETFCRRMTKGLVDKLNINFFILDEVHLGNYHKLVKELNCHVLGFTATPKSTGKPELNEYFGDIAVGAPLSELIRIGRLCSATTYSINHDFSGVKIKRGDYDPKQLMIEFKKPKLWDGAFKEWERHAKGNKTICFNVSVEQSQHICNQFIDAGYKACHIDANTKDRDRLFRWYAEDKIDIICNVGVATTGTDLPSTQCILKNYATISIVKDVQVSGRGARVAENKKNFKIIDLGRNWFRHGKFGEFIDWEAIFNNPGLADKRDAKKTNQRECEQCGAVIPIKLKRCPYCQHEITEQQQEKIILSGATTEEIREYRLQKLPPNLRKDTKNMSHLELKEYAEHMGYNNKWVHVMRNVWRKRN